MGDSYRLLIDYRIASSRHIVKSTFLDHQLFIELGVVQWQSMLWRKPTEQLHRICSPADPCTVTP